MLDSLLTTMSSPFMVLDQIYSISHEFLPVEWAVKSNQEVLNYHHKIHATIVYKGISYKASSIVAFRVHSWLQLLMTFIP